MSSKPLEWRVQPSFELQNLDSNYVPYTTMLVKRDNSIDYHVMILARNGTILDKTSCCPTRFIKSAYYLFLTDLSIARGFIPIFDPDQIPKGNV